MMKNNVWDIIIKTSMPLKINANLKMKGCNQVAGQHMMQMNCSYDHVIIWLCKVGS